MWLQVVCCRSTITWLKLLFSCLSKVLVPIYRNTWYHIPEDHTLDTDLHKNLQSHVAFIMSVTKFWFAFSSTMLHCNTPHLLYRCAPLHMAHNCFTPHCTAPHRSALHCTSSHLIAVCLSSCQAAAQHHTVLHCFTDGTLFWWVLKITASNTKCDIVSVGAWVFGIRKQLIK